MMTRRSLMLLLSSLSCGIHAFTVSTDPLMGSRQRTTTTAVSVTRQEQDLVPPIDIGIQYTPQQLKEALQSLWSDSPNPDFDARHILGYPGHENLSKLQEITATVFLDSQRQQQDSGAPKLDELTEAAHARAQEYGNILNLQTVLQDQAPKMALAAEFKRASPSKGRMAPADCSAAEQGFLYAQAGASVISVLTEPRWFEGSLTDLTDIRLRTNAVASRPAILRKDFVVNEYMIAQAAAAGADTILLIVAVLPQHVLQRLIQYARSAFGMEPLVEVHALSELEVALQAGAKVIGVNNRNLHNFQLDLQTSEKVAQVLQSQGLAFAHPSSSTSERPEYTLCALSGMSNAMDVHRYRQVGLGMCLIGESLMRAPDPAAVIQSLCLHPDDYLAKQQPQSATTGAYTAGTQLIKVCGMMQPEDALQACRVGANLIGVIFAEKSPRKVTSEQATAIVQTVRRFGERTQRLEFPLTQEPLSSPVLHLTHQSTVLAQTATPQRPAVVGVFQNQDPAFIQEMVETCGLDMVQLHGSEGMEACRRDQCGGVPALRVVDIHVDPDTGATSEATVDQILESLTQDPVGILLDTAIRGGQNGGGGTGQAFDWSVAGKIQDAGLPVLVAGGLTPDSVGDCIGQVRPFGVDVSSGVEASKGKKDHDAVDRFVRGARTAANQANQGF